MHTPTPCLIWLIYTYSVKGPEVINMYVGQSEENIREGKQLQFTYINY